MFDLAKDLNTILEGDADQIWCALDQCIVAINRLIEDAVNHILHHPRFQELERMWMGLAMLVDAIGDKPLVKIELLNLSKQDLLEDFEDYLDLSDCGFFLHLYKTEYDQAGGEPFGCILLQYEFNNAAQDLYLYKSISKVAASCHCPAIANVNLGLFGVKNYEQLEEIEDFDLLFQQPQYIKWRELRKSEDARYLALLMPRILVRHPYREVEFNTFRFTEVCRKESDFVWTYATYGFGVLLGRSFVKHGWCVHIRGPKTGGLLDVTQGIALGQKGLDIVRFPLEAIFSDNQEHRLSNQGFIVLNYFKETRHICVFSAPTVQAYVRDRMEKFSSNDRLAASLPYIFLVSRIAHYQKVIQRENVGTVKESRQLEGELREWLEKLVTQMPDPNMDIRSRYPLRGGRVKVAEDAANPGFFDVELILQPHLQLEGINAELTLISKLPRNKE